MTDVVIVHPGGVHGIYGSLGAELVSREQPLWARLIAGYLLDRGVTVSIIDAEVADLSAEQVVALVIEEAPKLVVIWVAGHQPSASTQAMPAAREIAMELTLDYDGLVVMGGNHPSALPMQTLMEEAVDYVIDGEGPVTIMGLLDANAAKDIPGLVWWKEENLGEHQCETYVPFCNPRAPLLDINRDLHGRAWHLLPPPSRYRAHNWQCFGDMERRSPYAAIHTTLGCAFECSFCMINIFQHTNRYRMRDPAAVVEEMVMLHRDHGVRTFKIIDELFVLNRRHYRAVCEGLIASGISDDINVWAYARPDTVNDGELALLRRAGIRWLALGIEAGAASVRDGADKSMSQDDIRDVVHAIEGAGIHVGANYIFGLPGETRETMAATLNLAREMNTSWANFYTAQAYPGSRLYDEAIKNGWQLPAIWAGYSQHNEHTLPLAPGPLTAAEILAFRDMAFRAYFTSQRYLDSATQKFGRAGRAHIEKMTGYRLKRNLLGSGETTTSEKGES